MVEFDDVQLAKISVPYLLVAYLTHGYPTVACAHPQPVRSQGSLIDSSTVARLVLSVATQVRVQCLHDFDTRPVHNGVHRRWSGRCEGTIRVHPGSPELYCMGTAARFEH